MAKLPALLIYPGDWLRSALAGCSLEAQGLYLRLKFLMHDSERYGYLQINGKPIPDKHVARRCGTDYQAYLALIAELDDFGLLNRTREGILYDPEMIEQHIERVNNKNRQKDFQNRKRAEKSGVMPYQERKGESQKNDLGSYNGSPPKKYNGDITPDITPDITAKKQGYSSSSSSSVSPSASSSKVKANGSSGGGSNARARAEDPAEAEKPAAAATAAAAEIPRFSVDEKGVVRLTQEEKQMSNEAFLAHLQRIYPGENVSAVAAKLRDFCRRDDLKRKLKPTRELLVNWVMTEHKKLEEEFLASITDEENEKGQKTDEHGTSGTGARGGKRVFRSDTSRFDDAGSV